MIADRIDLVCVDRARSGRAWAFATGSRVIQVKNVPTLIEAFRNGVTEMGKEITRVIFDHSSDSTAFLQFLSEMPAEFRGDVLSIQENGRAFLSAPAPRGDGRVLYTLSESDLELYFAAAYATTSIDPVVRETNYFKIAAAS